MIRQEQRLFALLLVLPTIFYLLSLGVFPLVYSIFISTKSLNLALPWKTHSVGMGNYFAALKDTWFHQSLQVTAYFVAGAVGIELLAGTGIALLLNRPIKGMNIFRVILFMPVIMTPVVVSLMWRLMYHPELGILNILLEKVGITGPAWLATPTSAMVSIMIVDIWQWTPYIFMVLLAGLTALPREPFEAAKVGGASSWQTFRYITIPLLRPIILIVVLIRVMDAIRIFDIVFILTGGGPALSTELLSLYIYRIGFRFFRMGYASALSIILLVVTIMLVNGLIKVVGRRPR